MKLMELTKEDCEMGKVVTIKNDDKGVYCTVFGVPVIQVGFSTADDAELARGLAEKIFSALAVQFPYWNVFNLGREKNS